MRVTALGHSSVLVELSRSAVLIDPVFFDPFGEGAVVSCPSREIDPARLPKLDLVVLTQAGVDHFDLSTLERLPRDCMIVCPKAPTMLYALEKLGFTSVRPVDVNSLLKFGKFELLTTPSTRPELEFGVVLKDQTGTFWDQVDTNLTAPMIDHVRAVVGRIHLLFAPYALQNVSYVGSQRAGFPVQTVRAHIASILRTAPTLVVPSSAGFRFTEPFAWTNAFVFPISRTRFLDELARAAPEQRSAIGDPGDVFEIAQDAVIRHRAASPVATMLRDDTHLIDFDPTAHVPPLQDPNCDGLPIEVIDRQVDETLEELTRFVRESYRTSEPLIDEHRRARTIYGLGVVFPDGSERWLRIHFEPTEPIVVRGQGPIRGALTTHRIAASVLTARARYERSYFYTGGLSRLSLISGATLIDGKVEIVCREPPDLLIYYLHQKPPGPEEHWKTYCDHQLARLRGARA